MVAISKVFQIVGVARSTLLYYEKIGIGQQYGNEYGYLCLTPQKQE